MRPNAKRVERPLPSPLTYSIAEVAKLLGVSPSLIRLQIKNKELPSLRMRRRVLIPRSALAAIDSPVAD
jgi:excisionase family DNA binding protein